MNEFEEPEPEKFKISKDEQYLLASGLYKCCRLGNAEQAVKFAEKLKLGTSPYYVMRILSQLVGEDGAPEEFVRLIPAVRTLYEASKKGDLRWHDIPQMTFAIAQCRKWYQTEEGIELELIRHEVNSKNKEIKVIEADFLFDQHTREGIRRVKEGTADLRLSGKWEHRFQLMERWKRLASDYPALSYEELRRKWILMHYDKVGGRKNGQTEIKGATESGVEGTKQPDSSQDV